MFRTLYAIEFETNNSNIVQEYLEQIKSGWSRPSYIKIGDEEVKFYVKEVIGFPHKLSYLIKVIGIYL